MRANKEIQKLARVVTARALLGDDATFDKKTALAALDRLRMTVRIPNNVVIEITRCINHPSDRSGNIVASLLSKHVTIQPSKESLRVKAEEERLAKKESSFLQGIMLKEVFMMSSDDHESDPLPGDSLVTITAEQYRKTYGKYYNELRVIESQTDLGDDYDDNRNVYTLWGIKMGDAYAPVISSRDRGKEGVTYMGNPEYVVG